MSEFNPVPPDNVRYSTLRDLMAGLFRNKRLAILTFCGVSFGAILFTLLWAARYYTATMEVLVQANRTDSAITSSPTSPIANSEIVSQEQVNSEMALLQGEDTLRSVASTCGLDRDWSPSDIFLSTDPTQRKAQKLAKATAHLAKGIDVQVEKISNIIDVKYGKTGSPETPACVLRTLSKLYLEKHLQLGRPAGSSGFFAQQTEQFRKSLEEAESHLANFGLVEGIAAPDAVRSDMALALANSIAALHHTHEAIAADEERIKNVQSQIAATPPRSGTVQVSNSAETLLQQLQANLLSARLKRTQLLLKYEADYPLVKEADQEIADTLGAISEAQRTQYVNQTTDRDPTYELLREDLAKTKADLASQKAAAAAGEHSIKSMQMQMVDLDRKAVKQTALLREEKADENNYLLYLQKREEERTSDAMDSKRMASVSIAVPPQVPAIPTYTPIVVLLIGLILALFMSVGVAYVADHFDSSFRTPSEVFEILNIPLVASIPKKAA